MGHSQLSLLYYSKIIISESLYQECNRTSIGLKENSEEKIRDLINTVAYLKEKIQEMEKESENANCRHVLKNVFETKLIWSSSCRLANENDNFNKLDSIDKDADVSMREANIPHSPLDSCLMLSINGNETSAVEDSEDHPQALHLENYRNDLEKELDKVKQESVSIFSEITSYSEENSTLEEQNKLLNEKIEMRNVLSSGLQKVTKKVRKSGDCEDHNIISERDQNAKKDEYISTSFIFVNSEKDLEEKDEISKLKSKIFELEENMKIVEEKYESDKKDLVNKNE